MCKISFFVTKNDLFYIFFQKYLVMSKNCSTFAPAFDKKASKTEK